MFTAINTTYKEQDGIDKARNLVDVVACAGIAAGGRFGGLPCANRSRKAVGLMQRLLIGRHFSTSGPQQLVMGQYVNKFRYQAI